MTALDYETTLLVDEACLCLGLQRASRVVARHFDDAFRPLDLNNNQFSLLMALNQPEPPTIGWLGCRLAMDRTTVTAGLKPLERRGLVEIRPDKRDSRARRIVLTRSGRALLEKAVGVWRMVNDAIAATFNARELSVLRSALRSRLNRKAG
jgi:DNA-binding MarR family transcriptional regulator